MAGYLPVYDVNGFTNFAPPDPNDPFGEWQQEWPIMVNILKNLSPLEQIKLAAASKAFRLFLMHELSYRTLPITTTARRQDGSVQLFQNIFVREEFKDAALIQTFQPLFIAADEPNPWDPRADAWPSFHVVVVKDSAEGTRIARVRFLH